MTAAVPAPPPDRALPALPTALSAPEMEGILAARLGDRVLLRSCRPCYVRYKPATSCIVQYRLELEDADDGRIHEAVAHAKLYADGRAERVWARGAVQELADTARAWRDGVPHAPWAAHLPELAAVLQLYPVDVALPALAFAASPAGRRRVLEDAVGRAEPAGGGVELLRYKPARKALLRYETAGGGVYAKLYAHERGAMFLRAGRALLAAGVPAATALAYLPDLRLLAYAGVTGIPLHTLAGTPDFERGVRAAADALAHLHGVAPVAGLPVHGWTQEGAALAASARAVAVLCPGLAAEAAAVAERAVEAIAGLPPASATLHGDFYDDQVLVDESGAVLLDFDGACCGHPLVDVGNFLAHLTVRDPDHPARDVFLDAYSAAPRRSVALLEAAALLKLAVGPFRRLEPDWPDGVERRLRLAARRLDEYRPAAAVPRERRLDPTLPQLAVLRDPALMRGVLEEACGEAVEVVAATIVRHKPGRRCLLRYDVLRGPAGRPERLYGKTFASERGPRVHKRLSAIAGAGGCGRADVPEPVAYVGALKLALQREVPGGPARPALLTGDRRLAGAAAEAVAALHGSAVELDHRHELEDELAILRGRVERLGAGQPSARRCLARIESAAARLEGWRLRPVHRDFYHDQLLVQDGRLAVLDFDDAAMSEPAVDVANFLAHLRLLALEEPAHAEAVDAAADAFRRRSHQLDPALDASLVRLLEGATLLRLACIHELFTARLVDEAEALLGGRRTRREPALEGPRILALVTEAAEELTGARPHVCRPVPLRAKHGRTVMRYELETDRGPIAIVAKLFADDRAGTVAAVLSALREHGFAGGEHAVPAPIRYERDVLLTETAVGPSLRSVLEQDPTATARAGAWLARFHTCGAALPGSRPPAALAPMVAAWGEEHAALAPIAVALAAALRAAPDPALPVHFDYSSADVLVPENGPTVVVDFDDAAMGDPAFDVVNFEATLRLRALRRAGDAGAFVAAWSAFRAGYAGHAPLPPASPAVEALVWARLAYRALYRGADEELRRYALECAAASLAGETRG